MRKQENAGPDYRTVVSKRQCYAPCADIVIIIVSHKEAALKTQFLMLTVRKDIECKKLHGEAESVDQNGVDEWQTNCLAALLKQFKAEEIFNAHETGLFY